MAKSKTKKKNKTRPAPNTRDWKRSSPVEETYSINMQALRSYYPELAQAVSRSNSERFQLEWNGQPTLPNLWDKGQGRYYYRSGNPMEEVRCEMAELKLKNARMVMFLGMGLGYELHHYLECYAREQNTRYFLIIEKELEVFKAALHVINMAGVISNPNFRFVVGEDGEKLYPLFRDYLKDELRYYLLKALRPIYHSSALMLNRDYYMSALQSMREAGVHQVLNYGNAPQDSLVGIENMLSNIQEIIYNPGINLLYNKFVNKPAVVVSTGPSLDKNKHLLKGIEDKALLIAADASLRVLIDMGVKPHLVTSLERFPDTAVLFEGFEAEQVDEVYMAACPVIAPETYAAYPGPRIIVYRNFDHFRWLGIDKGTLDIKLSAGNMAYKVADALGCNPIILIGQDLAFGQEGNTHAQGSVNSVDGVDTTVFRDGGRIIETMGNNGEMIKTNETWYSFLKSYEVDLASSSSTCINSTEGGALIQGTEVMPFSAAIEKYVSESFYPRETLKKALESFSFAEVEKALLHVVNLIDTTIGDMQQILGLCKEGINLCEENGERLYDCLKSGEIPSGLKQSISEIERAILLPKHKCCELHHTFQLFFAHVIQSYAIRFEIEMTTIPEKYSDSDLARIEILLRYKEWYAVIGDLANICVNSLLKAKSNLQELLTKDRGLLDGGIASEVL